MGTPLGVEGDSCVQPAGAQQESRLLEPASSTRTSGLQTGEKGRPAIRAPVCAVCHAAGCPGWWALCDTTWAPSNRSGPKPVMMDALRRAGPIPQGEEDPPPQPPGKQVTGLYDSQVLRASCCGPCRRQIGLLGLRAALSREPGPV